MSSRRLESNNYVDGFNETIVQVIILHWNAWLVNSFQALVLKTSSQEAKLQKAHSTGIFAVWR